MKFSMGDAVMICRNAQFNQDNLPQVQSRWEMTRDLRMVGTVEDIVILESGTMCIITKFKTGDWCFWNEDDLEHTGDN